MLTINPQDWITQLKVAVDSHHPKTSKGSEKSSGHSYIIVQDDHVSLSQDSSQKLSIKEIADISKKAIDKLQAGYQKSEQKDSPIYTRQISDIQKYTDALINAREAKANQPFRMLVRVAALVVSAVASLVLIGIPFFILIRKAEKNFRQEIENWKKDIKNTAESAMPHSARIQAYVQKFGISFEQALQLTDVESAWVKHENFFRENYIQETFLDDFKRHMQAKRQKPLEQFTSDLNRGTCFRTHPEFEISPKMKNDKDELISDAVMTIQQVCQGDPKSDYWELAIQSAVSQTSANALVGGVMADYNQTLGNIQWQESGKEFQFYSKIQNDSAQLKNALNDAVSKGKTAEEIEAIRKFYSKRARPVNVVVIRERDNTIKQVMVSVQTHVDIIKRPTGKKLDDAGREVFEVVTKDALMATLTYTITLGKENEPMVSNLKPNYNSAIQL